MVKKEENTLEIPLYIIMGFMLLLGIRVFISDNYECLESITVCGDNDEHLEGCICTNPNNSFEIVDCYSSENVNIRITEEGVAGKCIHHKLFDYEWRKK